MAVSRGGVREDRGKHARGDRRERRGGRTWPLGWVRALPPRVRGRGGQQILPSRGGSWAGHAQQMGPRGSADPTHDGRDGLLPVRDFSRVGGIGSTPKRAAATGAPGPRPGWEFRFQASGPHTMPGTRERGIPDTTCSGFEGGVRSPYAEGNSATRSTTPRQIRRCVRHFRSHPTTGTGERTDCSARSKWRRTSRGSRAMMFGRVSTLSLALFRCSCPCSATSHRGHARGLDPMAGLQIAHPLGRSIARAEGLGVRAPMPDATADGRHSGPVRERNRVGRSPSPTKGGHGSKRSGCGEDTFRKEKWREWRDSNP